MASAFIIEVGSQLQPDPNEETAALLRVLIHKVDNTTFGDNVPALPQWYGPPHTIIQVQAILLASLAASLFSAFLAMLGRQWLNRYALVDVRGSSIDRGRNRQRKLDGIVSWYFDHVMESLPLMLQTALLLLGCALSRYLWEINTIIASVVLGVTSFGLLFYLFIAIAGAVFVSCPYQTPSANILPHLPDTLRHILDILRRIPDIFRHTPRIPGALHSALSTLAERSACYKTLSRMWDRLKAGPRSLADTATALVLVLLLPFQLIVDTCVATIWLLIVFPRRVYSLLQQELEQQTAALDLHCISWTLRTSLDEPVRLSTLNYLATTTPAVFDPTLVIDCFNILFDCVKVTNGIVMITPGSERIAAVSALCCLHTLSYLAVTNSMHGVLENVHQRYTRVFPFKVNFDDRSCSHTLGAIHRVFYPACVDYNKI